jgi:hypothetical protein
MYELSSVRILLVLELRFVVKMNCDPVYVNSRIRSVTGTKFKNS